MFNIKNISKKTIVLSTISVISLVLFILLICLTSGMRYFYLATFSYLVLMLLLLFGTKVLLKNIPEKNLNILPLNYNKGIKNKTKNIFIKIRNYFQVDGNIITFIKRVFAVFLVLFLIVRTIGGYDYLEQEVVGLTSSFMSPFYVGVSVIFNQIYTACIFLVAISQFLNSKIFHVINKYLVTPLFILCSICMPLIVEGVVGNVFSNGILSYDPYYFRIIFMALEYASVLGFLTYIWIYDYKIEFKKEYVFPILITSILIILTLPNDYMFKVLFQESYLNIPTPIDLNYTHRIMIYLAFILPVIYFVLLYKFDIPHRRAFLTFISFMALFSYIAIRRYETWSSVGALPLHLCNTAMYIIPLTLVFKSHKVFYFTMFINVIGAFLALLMPNYDINGIFSSYTIEFFINHLYAFFMPILIVLLGVYERPKTKYFMYSMIGFFLYFVLCVTLNTIYGSNFFFLNDDFIVSKLGSWAEDIFRDFYFTVEVNGSLVEIRYLYLIIFYLIYVVLALFMWFIYEILFKGVDSLTSLYEKNVKYNQNKLNFIKLQKEKGVDMNKINYKEIQNKPATLDIIHLKKKYGKNDFYTIKDFSLHLEGGKIYGFLGKNGAGKSTIIKSIVGMHTFDGGEIKACGFDVVYQEVEAKSCIGFVPDHYALYESLTGRQYINYIADLYDVSLEDRNTRLDELLNKLELKDKFDKQIRTYSHGMKQKLTIIGALIHNPKIWILDEPMTGVDPNSIYQIKECMKDHAKKGNIVFFSSHLIDVVKNLCDEVIIIKHGDFIMRDSVENLNKNNVDLEKLFLEMTADDKKEENKLLKELEAAK